MGAWWLSVMADGPWMIQNGKNAKQFGDAIAAHDIGCKGVHGPQRLECLRALPTTAVATHFNSSWMCANKGWNVTYDPWCLALYALNADSRTGVMSVRLAARHSVRLEV